MINDFIFSLNAVLPVFMVIFLGQYIFRKGLLDKKTVDNINAITFTYALPLMLFRDISVSDFKKIFDVKLILFAVAVTLIIFVLAWVISLILVKDDYGKGAFVQGSFRGNYAILGLPLAANILGDSYTGKAVLITTFIIPLYNVLAVIVLSFYQKKDENNSSLLKTTIKNIFKNPLIRGILFGIPFSLLQIKMPQVITRSIDYMAVLATPLALLAIGASINIQSFKAKIKPAAAAAVIKILITPLIFLPIAFLLGMSSENLVIIFVMCATPTAISSYIMAYTMGSDDVLAANIILFTTFFSMFTFTIGVFIFKTLGLI